MDIASHGLWGVALTRYYNIRRKKTDRRYEPLQGFFWGVLPDFVAFAPTFIFAIAGLFTGSVHAEVFARKPGSPPPPAFIPFYDLAILIYNFSHSLVIFGLVFAGVVLIGRMLPGKFRVTRPPWEMFAWPLHILMDIPTHSSRFFPTPFLWPLSDIHVNGTPWATPWIFIPNWILLILAFWWTRKKLRAADRI